jgi:hypothetical protein
MSTTFDTPSKSATILYPYMEGLLVDSVGKPRSIFHHNPFAHTHFNRMLPQ